MTPSLRWPLLPLAGVLALALLAVFVAAPERTAQADHVDPPTNLTKTADSTSSITVVWSAPADASGVTHYVIGWKLSTASSFDLDDQLIRPSSSSTSRAISSLAAGTYYDIQVHSCSDGACNHRSDTAATLTTHTAAPDGATAPAAPVLNYEKPQNRRTDPLTWTAPNSGGSPITDYEYRSREQGETNWGDWTSTMSTGTAFGVDKGATTPDQLKTYEYQVRAVNIAGDGAASNTVHIATYPTGLGTMTATAATTGVSVSLSWPAPTNTGGKDITNYIVQWRRDSNNNWGTDGPIGSKPVGTATSVTLTDADGLMGGTTYNFRHRADNEDRVSFFHPGDGSVEATMAPADPPPAPQNLVATRQSSTSVRLTWAAPVSDGGATITDYLVQWSKPDETTWSNPEVLTPPPDPLQYDVTGLEADVEYGFRVAAVNSATTTSNANWATVGPPGKVLNVVATTASATRIDFTWDPPAEGSGTAFGWYEPQYRVAAEDWQDAGGSNNPNSRSRQRGNLLRGTMYEFRVRACAMEQINCGPWSDTATATTNAAVSTDPPGKVLNVVATTHSTTRIDFTWDAPAAGTGGTFGWYQPEFRIAGADEWEDAGGSNNLNSRSRQRAGLDPGTLHEFRVRACETMALTNCGPWSNTASATTNYIVPEAPRNFMAFALNDDDNGTDRLTWDPPANVAATEYGYQLRVHPQSWPGNDQGSPTDTMDDSVRSNLHEPFEYRVRAINPAGSSPYTEPVTVAGKPGAVSNLSATASTSEVAVTLSWTAPSNGGKALTGYQVEWRPDVSGSDWSTNGATGNTTAPGGATSLTVNMGHGLQLNTRYDFRIRADNSDRQGLYSNTADADQATINISATLFTTNPSPLTERGLNGGTVTVDLVGTTYASSLDASDFGLLPQNVAGLSVASVNRVSNTRAVLTLDFSGNFVTTISLQVVVDGSANAAGTSLTSDTVTVIQAPTPDKVTGVGAEPGPASLTVTWGTVDHADGYRVSVRRSGDASDVTIRDVPGGSTTRAGISGLLGDTEYMVRVRANSNFAANGNFSDAYRVTTQPGHAIVSSTDPSPLTEGNLDGAVLTVDLLPGIYDPWAPRLDRATVTVSGVPGVTTTIADVTRVSDERMLVRLAYDGTDFDTDRVLRVEFTLAHTSIGTITAVADVKAVDEQAPGQVQNVRVTPGPLKVRVTWDPVDDATGYRLEWSPPAAFGSSVNVRPTRYTIGALLPDTQYTVRVVATKTRAPDGEPSASVSETTPAFGARLVRTEPSELTEDNLHGARLTVDVQGVEWERLVEGRYYRSQLGWLNDCSEAKYYDNCYPFIVTRSVVVTGVERVSSSRVVVSLWARSVDLQGKGLWIRFPDDLHTHYYGEPEYMVVQLIAPDQPGGGLDTAQNNRAGVTVTAADPVSVNEGGGSASYTVVLDGQPSGDVVIAMSSSNGDVTTQPASLTFTRDNWDTAQTVTVRASQDDDAVDDSATISHAVSGAQGYAGIDVASVSVSVSDDDTAGVTVHPTSLSVNEGGSATYTVALDAQPVSDVLITLFANGVTAQPADLTFTSGNWNTAQTVTVSAPHDDDTEDGTGLIFHGIGADPESAYVSVTVPGVNVSITDDDEPTPQPAQQEPEPEPGSVTVSASSLGVREGDDGATYTVVLDVEPTENVTITVSSDNGDVTAEPASLTFTTGNWQSAQTVTVSAGEDEDRDDELAIVSHTAGGGNYDGVTVGFVTVIVTDDDSTVEVLRDFYYATDGGNWTDNDGWLSGQPLGEWHGITVNEDGEVTHLALRDNNLVGTLAPELGKLESLEVLSLDRNSISGELPVELGDLSNLTRLAMNRNSLSGAIPAELGSLSNLSIIGLARNQLSGGLPASLGNLTGLTRLSLHDNTGLSGALPSGFTGLTNLQRLAIANTGLCAPDDEAFTAWLDGVADKPGGVTTCE